jgi:hypothetical protein
VTAEQLRRIVDGLSRLPVRCMCRERIAAGARPSRWQTPHHWRCPVTVRMLLLARYQADSPVMRDEHHVVHGRPEWGRWRWHHEEGEWRVHI